MQQWPSLRSTQAAAGTASPRRLPHAGPGLPLSRAPTRRRPTRHATSHRCRRLRIEGANYAVVSTAGFLCLSPRCMCLQVQVLAQARTYIPHTFPAIACGDYSRGLDPKCGCVQFQPRAPPYASRALAQDKCGITAACCARTSPPVVRARRRQHALRGRIDEEHAAAQAHIGARRPREQRRPSPGGMVRHQALCRAAGRGQRRGAVDREDLDLRVSAGRRTLQSRGPMRA
jgi:hypothetical protein